MISSVGMIGINDNIYSYLSIWISSAMEGVCYHPLSTSE